MALCPTGHALHHREGITIESIRTWKAILVALSQAFDVDAVDKLLFLSILEDPKMLKVSGDGVLSFAHLIGAGLAGFEPVGGLQRAYGEGGLATP